MADVAEHSLIGPQRLRAVTQEKAREEVERLLSDGMRATITRATDEGLLDNFQTGFKSLKCVLKYSFYIFVEHM